MQIYAGSTGSAAAPAASEDRHRVFRRPHYRFAYPLTFQLTVEAGTPYERTARLKLSNCATLANTAMSFRSVMSDVDIKLAAIHARRRPYRKSPFSLLAPERL